MENSWQVERRADDAAAFFVPAAMGQKVVTLQTAQGGQQGRATVEGNDARHSPGRGGWAAEPHLKPGGWNEVRVEGSIDGARLVAAEPLHIVALEARWASERSIAVRIRLSLDSALAPAEQQGSDTPRPRATGLLSLFFAVSDQTGRQVGGMEITIGHRTRDLSVEMPLVESLTGAGRLKASLCMGDVVIDNARIELDT